jgi:hypothetical protein
MQNSNSQSKPLDTSIMEWLSNHSSTILIISALSSFLISGALEFFHYQDVFGKSLSGELAITFSLLFALFFQGVRCATIANSARLFRKNNQVRGAITLLVSLAVTVFCAYEAKQIAATWENGHPEIAGFIHLGVLCVVWAGWVLELILVISVAGDAVTPQPAPAKQPQKPSENGRYQEEPTFFDGKGGTY